MAVMTHANNKLPVRWSGVELSPLEFVNGYAQSLPIIICVTEGHDGGDNLHSISTDEVFLY